MISRLIDESKYTKGQSDAECYQKFMEHCTDLYTCHTDQGMISYISPTVKQLLGYDSTELLGKSLHNICHPDDREKIKRLFQYDVSSTRTNYRVRKKGGEYIWFETSCKKHRNGDTIEYLCITRDVTHNIIAELELQENKTKYELLVENFQDTVGIITLDGYWIYLNQAGVKLFGVTRKEEIIGKNIVEFISKDDEQRIRNYFVDHNNKTLEVTVLRCDFDTKQVEVKVLPRVYRNRETFQIVLRDITEHKKTEELMYRSEKLSVIGQLAAGIAHEIRNPLTTVKGFTQLMKSGHGQEFLHVMIDEMDRIEQTISDLLILGKPQVSNIEKINVQTVIESTVSLLSAEALLHNIELVQECDLPEPYMEGEEDKLKLVFINIIKNAIEAMPNGGKIYITAEQEDGTIVIKIMDKGIGIPPERLKKLGEPFYSNKEKGTGLGLMICNRIIKNHQGSLQIESKVNEGTTLSVRLPKTLS
ncbi:PAS domain S-box protein [Evansella sp. AB-rgal1]|uniref:PAS domain-containing sensor histidine kinase n=1 Tax=Evansella sp. AB-rgal1 TaxID=3242696 RepID=UPI00359DD996